VVSPGTLVSSTNKTDRHNKNSNIVESGVKHHKSTQTQMSNCASVSWLEEATFVEMMMMSSSLCTKHT
jgi:hypothetical protein